MALHRLATRIRAVEACSDQNLQVIEHSGPALIVDVVHNEEMQRYFSRSVLEDGPYPFLCTQTQLETLAADIADLWPAPPPNATD